jgi:hypothetical protein
LYAEALTLAEGDTANYAPRLERTRGRNRGSRVPRKRRPLTETYRHRLQDLCIGFSRDLEAERLGPLARAVNETQAGRDARIIRDYEGVPTHQVAIRERLDDLAIKRLRQTAGRDHLGRSTARAA